MTHTSSTEIHVSSSGSSCLYAHGWWRWTDEDDPGMIYDELCFWGLAPLDGPESGQQLHSKEESIAYALANNSEEEWYTIDQTRHDVIAGSHASVYDVLYNRADHVRSVALRRGTLLKFEFSEVDRWGTTHKGQPLVNGVHGLKVWLGLTITNWTLVGGPIVVDLAIGAKMTVKVSGLAFELVRTSCLYTVKWPQSLWTAWPHLYASCSSVEWCQWRTDKASMVGARRQSMRAVRRTPWIPAREVHQVKTLQSG